MTMLSTISGIVAISLFIALTVSLWEQDTCYVEDDWAGYHSHGKRVRILLALFTASFTVFYWSIW